jgi:hypothetical protein
VASLLRDLTLRLPDLKVTVLATGEQRVRRAVGVHSSDRTSVRRHDASGSVLAIEGNQRAVGSTKDSIGASEANAQEGLHLRDRAKHTTILTERVASRRLGPEEHVVHTSRDDVRVVW